jgi:RNA polymerase sigma factor (sigma-70 family)
VIARRRQSDYETGMRDDEAQDRRWAGLMAEAQDGGQAAYATLLREVAPFIRSIVGRQHRTRDRIDDVVQDVLLTVHRIRHTYDPARPFRPWLAAIAGRRSIDALRRRGRTEAMEIADDASLETFADPAANKEGEARDAATLLAHALPTLPAGQRQALELVKMREMTLAEASAASGQSVGGLKVNVHRAIKSLRAILGSKR